MAVRPGRTDTNWQIMFWSSFSADLMGVAWAWEAGGHFEGKKSSFFYLVRTFARCSGCIQLHPGNCQSTLRATRFFKGCWQMLFNHSCRRYSWGWNNTGFVSIFWDTDEEVEVRCVGALSKGNRSLMLLLGCDPGGLYPESKTNKTHFPVFL